ncbi:unnamed protein product [Danaus chrysippus]|uniref:Nicastrin n=1 Tax=Danaus chrysippus TaxID=151541 RepID=A0A8J2R471_9NEOP|nr:unnamed protein product [Danaus chrysippus]
MISNISDAQWMVYNSSAGPYVAVVNTIVFNEVIEIFMQEPTNVAGILLYENATERPDFFSPETQCPNENSVGPDGKCAGDVVWNENGSGLLRRDIPFPIFFLPSSRISEIDKITQCHDRYNLDKDNQKGRPLCSLQLSSFMYAAVNTAVCLRRSATSIFGIAIKMCDPLGDYNVYSSLFPRPKETAKENKQVILVTARMDAASLFDGVAPGAASAVVGLVTLITTAATLSQMIPLSDAPLYNKNVLFTLFNGESYDYIGSQRVAYDISRGVWPPLSPITSKDINLHVELGQLGGSLNLFKDNPNWPLYAYAPYTYAIPPQVTEFLAEMSSYSQSNNMTIESEFSINLPPSSLHSFRKILSNATESGELPEILLVDHVGKFTNKFYQSALDDYESIGYTYHNITISNDGKFISTDDLISNGTMSENEAQVKVARVATSLAHTLYQQIVGTAYTGNISSSAHLVDEMLYCFLRSQACRLLVAADYYSNEDTPPDDRPAPLYVGVAAASTPAALYSGHLLALLTGTHLQVNRTACDKIGTPGFSYYYLRGWNHSGICIQTTMNFSQAISPAFIKPDYNITSAEFSTWTESVWLGLWARVFVRAAGVGARVAAAAGAFATILAAFTTYWLQRHASVIFLTPVADNGAIRSVNC